MNLKGTKTERNLAEAFAGESQARNKYTYFASVAKKEGFQQIAAIEKTHEERYRKLLANVEMKKVFEKAGETMWECRNCGHLVLSTKAPEVCPTCFFPQAYFEVHAENY